jgi:hypothetical protein
MTANESSYATNSELSCRRLLTAPTTYWQIRQPQEMVIRPVVVAYAFSLYEYRLPLVVYPVQLRHWVQSTASNQAVYPTAALFPGGS